MRVVYTTAMAERPQIEISPAPRYRATLVMKAVTPASLFLSTLIIFWSTVLPNPDYFDHPFWIITSAVFLTYTHHFAVLYLESKYQHIPKKSPVVSTLWCIITLLLIGTLWLVAVAFLLFGLTYIERLMFVPYAILLLSTLVEAGLIVFLGRTCISERKHAEWEYEGLEMSTSNELWLTMAK
ncbi:uncharacterized protein EV420DRAFT_1185151 [Desarmillaria tabescens]|uniref:Uncharacterized protein n=1 Tax=Armillaria tabescens TaxID=1929756 RepID=A0AA39NB57_ARMTA|nr:uncharacterized protein EV420DRAFT_1185151 [Desarmillaria tabescens]KAK0462406.1 hypothetical protein EV420DRAFT_1185151 [Desarmillaria tabescens]